MPKIKWIALMFLLVLLIYTRFLNLSWGLPYPLHPDERNIANSVQQLQCNYGLPITDYRFWKNCFNPHFFAYGQFLIYLGYFVVLVSRLFTHYQGEVRFDEAVMALRIISAVASVVTVFVSIKIIKQLVHDGLRITKPNPVVHYYSYLLLIFTPVLIQLAHFGTTESLLMLFYTLLIHVALSDNRHRISLMGIIVGLAVGTKVSSVIFAAIPLAVILRSSSLQSKIKHVLYSFFLFAACFLTFYFLSSPHNLISFQDFLSSFNYESGVALGKTPVFYTRSFVGTIPILFQFQKVFPYALGLPLLLLFFVGLIVLPWKKEINFLRFAFLIYFIPSAFTFTKWTRFMAPIFPLMIIFSILSLYYLYHKYKLNNSKSFAIILLVVVACCVYPGIQFLKVYASEDIRFQASEWIAKNIPANSLIIQDIGNAVDLPIAPSSSFQAPIYRNIPFDFYNLDQNPVLQTQLHDYLAQADYIIVPSRRVFMNHSLSTYPLTAKYYADLFSGKLGFDQVAEFKILNDEKAEETWTVFDHPVIRIFKRVANK